MIKILLSFILFLHLNCTYACSCGELDDLKQAQEFFRDRSDLIFTARVIESNWEENHYKLEIIEIFKGNPTDSIISGKYRSSCSEFPETTDGIWLIYADFYDGYIDIPQCGLSRSFDFPYIFNKEAQIYPPPQQHIKNSEDWVDYELLTLEYKKRALKILKDEIENLRKLSAK